MCANLTTPVSHVAYENLVTALAYERDSINAAYDSLLALASRGVSSDDALTHASNVLHGLTGMLRFIFERVYNHTCETSITFLREVETAGGGECTKAVAALQDAIMTRVLSPIQQKIRALACNGDGGKKAACASKKRCAFAISSQYDLDDRKEIIAALTQSLNHAVVLLRRSEASQEVDLALQFGCSVLVSPASPAAPYSIAHATKEKVMQYAQSSLGKDEDNDDELDALVCALDCRARTSTALTDAASLRAPTGSPTTMASRDELRGAFGGDQPLVAAGEDRDDGGCDCRVSHNERHEVVVVGNFTEQSARQLTHACKRARFESPFEVFLSDVVGFAEAQLPLSQVIQYQPAKTSEGVFGAIADSVKRHVPDSSLWIFQISNSLKESKNELVRAIRRLGGRVENSSTYNPQTTHLVVAEGLAERTEKFLSCCAALKFIVPPSYVFDSAKRGKWLVDRLHEYDRNPLRRLARSPMTLLFAQWRVVLFTSTHSVASGVVTVLKAGGCADITSYVFDDAEVPKIDFIDIERSTHILVECQKLASTGRFLFPPWFPSELIRQDERFFSLELLFYLLCFSTSSVFDGTGEFLETEQQLPLSCRLEICCR